MKLRNKMALCMALVFALFAIALGVAIAGMQNAATQFDRFIQKDQAFLAASTSLYAQGLQMGQALRNVILSPANEQGYRNLDAARAAFGKALETAQSLSGDDAGASKTLANIKLMQARQSAMQQQIVALAKDNQAAAIASLNADETPLWRQIRGELLELIKTRNAAVTAAKDALAERTHASLMYSLLLAGGAIAGGAAA